MSGTGTVTVTVTTVTHDRADCEADSRAHTLARTLTNMTRSNDTVAPYSSHIHDAVRVPVHVSARGVMMVMIISQQKGAAACWRGPSRGADDGATPTLRCTLLYATLDQIEPAVNGLAMRGELRQSVLHLHS